MADKKPLPSEIDAYLEFFRAVEPLKDTLRSGFTARGRAESTAEHTWRACLMAVVLEDAIPEIDLKRLLQLLVVHDLGEVVRGDIPAPEQGPDKSAEERADMASLLQPLPPEVAEKLMVLWEEYTAASSPEARMAKGLDRLETILQHIQGQNPTDFDYAFNLDYGRQHTDAHPLIRELRRPIDAETERLSGGGKQ